MTSVGVAINAIGGYFAGVRPYGWSSRGALYKGPGNGTSHHEYQCSLLRTMGANPRWRGRAHVDYADHVDRLRDYVRDDTKWGPKKSHCGTEDARASHGAMLEGMVQDDAYLASVARALQRAHPKLTGRVLKHSENPEKIKKLVSKYLRRPPSRPDTADRRTPGERAE